MTRNKQMTKILKTLVHNQKENIFIELEKISLRTLIQFTILIWTLSCGFRHNIFLF